jgi:hypothetical protein
LFLNRDLSGDLQISFLGLASTTTVGTCIWILEPKLRRFGKLPAPPMTSLKIIDVKE